MVRCLLMEKKMPKNFWPDAVKWTVHVLNRSPPIAVKGKTPEERCMPNIDYFGFFEYICHVHIPNAKISKFDDMSYKAVLLGESEKSKAYRLFDPINKRVVTSRDVVFEENESPRYSKKMKVGTGKEVMKRLQLMRLSGVIMKKIVRLVVNKHIDAAPSSNKAVSSNSNSLENSSPNSPEEMTRERTRRAPVWMQDYTTGEGHSDEKTCKA